ncbi:MAG: mechanosensitive ion channel [Prevotella sp.]|nr:mechanosensitive ion channel [Prevotella sp.]
MENIRIFVEELISLTGLSGSAVPVLRHVLLVLIAILLAVLAGLLCRRIIVPIVRRLTAHTDARWDDVLFGEKVLISACHIVPAIVIWQLLPLVFYQYPVVRELLTRATAIYITVTTVRLVLVFISAVKELEGDERSARQQYLYSFMGVVRIVIIFVAVIIVVAIVLDRDPMKLFAGLGATSAVLMLVFQDTIKGLVAGIRLTSNDMLHKGDWITVPKAGANGIVEDMSLTTVKIRNFDNTMVTVTPQSLVDDSFQNWNGMQQGEGRRVNRTVHYDFRSIRVVDEALRKQLLDKKYFKAGEVKTGMVNMTLYRQYLAAWLSHHPLVNPDMTLMVRQMDPTPEGLPVEFYFFLKEKEWVPYENQMAEIMEHIYAVTPDFGLQIYQMFPHQ